MLLSHHVRRFVPSLPSFGCRVGRTPRLRLSRLPYAEASRNGSSNKLHQREGERFAIRHERVRNTAGTQRIPPLAARQH